MTTNFAFEPEMVEALAAAFHKSCSFISNDPQFSRENPALLQRQLAGYLMQLAADGERDPLRLANNAIYRIRHEYSAKLLVLWATTFCRRQPGWRAHGQTFTEESF